MCKKLHETTKFFNQIFGNVVTERDILVEVIFGLINN